MKEIAGNISGVILNQNILTEFDSDMNKAPHFLLDAAQKIRRDSKANLMNPFKDVFLDGR